MTTGKEYIVLGIECDDYRIINDNNDPCLYEPSSFEVIDPTEPEFWVKEYGEDGERYAYPIEWNEAGFFEDYHDNNNSVVSKFWQDCKKYYGISKHA
ncbi:hypothetical protein [Microbulbifer sp. PSTR4-B]|uniref:hypothetical protein n=1 Tax=Microbulbifer sp. PSTR4-B TaxID=3243396 RepID=UPI004039B53A